MKKWTKIIPAIFILGISDTYAQKTDTCRVLMNEISGVYQGDCKDGLAHGKGTAKGNDTYDGAFKNGFPDGKGKYVYENGNIFIGFWSKGLKNGQGKYVYYLDGKEYTQKGYWKNGDYVGISDPDEFYRITNQSGIENCSIKKLEDNGVQIKISFVRAMTKYVPRDLRVTTTSGQFVPENKNYIVYNYTCPNSCTIHFTIKTAGGNRICNLSFEILKSGKYEVLITNN